MKEKVEYWNDGKAIKETYFIDEKGTKQGTYENYDKEGCLSEKGTYKNGKPNGLIECYEEGKLVLKITYKDGEEDGPFEHYFRDGSLWEKGSLKKGKYDGIYTEYNEDGTILYRATYKEGKIADGLFENHRPGGEGKGAYYNGRFIPEKEVQRKGLVARLKQIDKQMPPTELRKAAKRAEVAKFRKKYPKSSGR